MSEEFNCPGCQDNVKPAVIGSYLISLKYDPMGNRVWRQSTVSGQTTTRKYIVDISSELPTILMELDPQDNMAIKKTYIYANAEVLCQHNGAPAPNNKFFYLHDRLGSVRLVIDDDGVTQNTYTYNPFGEMFATECTENIENNFKFTGQWYDTEIGQYYLRARQYDPQLMRFTSRDPENGKRKELLTLHKYLYCLNDPVNKIDPSGKMSAAEALALPVTAGYATHALAIAFVAYGVMHDTDYAINLGIAIERSIIGVMTLVSAGVDYWDALIHAVKQKDRDDFGKLREIGKDYGKTLEEVRDAIHRAKQKPPYKGKPRLTEDEIREILEGD